MCRLFGLYSITKSKVHQTLITAENALSAQSKEHPNGWGIAFFEDGAAKMFHGLTTAFLDKNFEEIAKSIRANQVLAHVRKATQGEVKKENCHPFKFGNCFFAHNGDFENFSDFKEELYSLIDPIFKNQIVGETDSELYFMLLLSELFKKDKQPENSSLNDLASAIRITIEKIENIYLKNSIKGKATFNNIILTHKYMLATRQGSELHFSTHKKDCIEKETCAYFNESCIKQSKAQGSQITHLLVSSEPLAVDNVWNEMEQGQIIGVDKLYRFFSSL